MSIKCIACQSNELQEFSNLESRFLPVKCIHCGLVQSDPMPGDDFLRQYYQGFSFQPPTIGLLNNLLPVIEASLDHFVGRPNGTGNFLDYGGGAGIYSVAAERLGWHPTLYDLDRDMIAFGRDRLGLNRITDNLSDLENSHFEVIFAFHVIEHWNGVDAQMDVLKRLLAPGGRIILATPNAVSVEKWARRSHFNSYLKMWVDMGMSETKATALLRRKDSFLCWDPPRHLLAFTPESLRKIGDRHGLLCQIFTGYNTDPIFEPRGYILQGYTRTIKMLRRNPFRALRTYIRGLPEAISALRTVGHLKLLSWIYPDLGEQLYVRYTQTFSTGKNSTSNEKS